MASLEHPSANNHGKPVLLEAKSAKDKSQSCPLEGQGRGDLDKRYEGWESGGLQAGVYRNRVEGNRPINGRRVHKIYRSVFEFPSMLTSGMTETHYQTPVVQNVVSFAKMSTDNQVLDLKLIAQKAQGCRYNKKRFPAVIMRKTKPKSTILVFKSGRMIIIGSESEADAEKAARAAIKDVSKAVNQKLKMGNFNVTNIVANADLGCKIDIGRLCDEEKKVIRNQNFPGVVYKNMENVKSALIFASGKVVFTGAKTKDDIDKAYIELKRKMEAFRKIT